MEHYFLSAEKRSSCHIYCDIEKFNKFFIGELNNIKYYLYKNKIFEISKYRNNYYLSFLGQKENILPSFIKDYFTTQNILNKLGYFSNDNNCIYYFVKKARKDYPEEGIKKGDSYYWTKKDRFSEKKRFKEKPL